MPQKSPTIWATFVRKFVTKNFQNSPNMVTLQFVSNHNNNNKALCISIHFQISRGLGYLSSTWKSQTYLKEMNEIVVKKD